MFTVRHVKPKTPKPANPPPPAQRARVGKPTTPHDAAVEGKLQMPNERDESVAMTADAPDPVIEQAEIGRAHV